MIFAHSKKISFQGRLAEQLGKTSGSDAWAAFKTETKSYMDLFDKRDLVYLTSDSSNVLEKLDPLKVYIIGGIVDRNRHKGVTFARAEVIHD